MALTACLLAAATCAPSSTWRLYEPKGSGIKFAMPGTVYEDSKPDPSGSGRTVHRFHATADGVEYTVLYADLAKQSVPAVKTLWAKDRNGDTVRQILENTLKGSPEEAGTIGVTRFGNMKGFPTLAQIVSHDDGTGSNLMAAFTPMGVVAATARSPKTPEATQDAFRFIDSIDLSARR